VYSTLVHVNLSQFKQENYQVDIQDELNKNGFVLLERLESERGLTEIACRIGKSWSGVKDANVHTISPKEQSASTPNTYSGNYGLEAFPLHTDLSHWRNPPRYLALRCKVGVPDVATLLLDGQSIIEKYGKSILSKALVQPRRPVQGAMPLLRLYRQVEGTPGMLRWDSLFITPASGNGRWGNDLLKEAIASAKPFSLYLRKPGDTLVIDNWRMLHGRSSVPTGSEERIIERMYLEEIN